MINPSIDESPKVCFLCSQFDTHQFTGQWLSGRKRSPAKGVYSKRVSRVRIPADPPFKKALLIERLFCFVNYAYLTLLLAHINKNLPGLRAVCWPDDSAVF